MGTIGTILLLIVAFFLVCGAITNFIAAAAKSAVPKTGKTTKVRGGEIHWVESCLLYTSPSPRDLSTSRMPSSA